jgi:hypothetical protein
MADLATQYPANPSFESVNFTTNTPTLVTNTLAGKLRRVGQGVSFYSWEIKYPTLTRIDAGTVKGYLAQALGPQFSFEIVLPTISYSALTGQTAQVPRTAQARPIGSTSISLTNCGSNGKVLAAGDYFVFSNHTKVYQCVSPCTADGSGNATLFYSGPLVSAVPLDTNLIITAVPFTAVLVEEVQEFEAGYGGLTQISVQMREVW